MAATQSILTSWCSKVNLLKLKVGIRMENEKGMMIFSELLMCVHHSEWASPLGSRMRGMLSSLSARRKASSRFCRLLLDPARERSTSCGLREHKMARKASPLLQLDPKSLTLMEQATLKTHRPGLVSIETKEKYQNSFWCWLMCNLEVQYWPGKALKTNIGKHYLGNIIIKWDMACLLNSSWI